MARLRGRSGTGPSDEPVEEPADDVTTDGDEVDEAAPDDAEAETDAEESDADERAGTKAGATVAAGAGATKKKSAGSAKSAKVRPSAKASRTRDRDLDRAIKDAAKGKPARGSAAGRSALSIRFVLALILIVGGIAWIAYYYVGVRAPVGIDPDTGQAYAATGWKQMREWKDWNYLIGFVAFFLGLAVSAHPSTPFGRGRGVVVLMLGCFLVGLAWICTFYVISNDPSSVPIFNDLGQKNLIVGIAAMAVGFTFATRWE